MKIFQHATLNADPTLPSDAATKQYVDSKMAAGGGTGLFVTNATAVGGNSTKTYLAGTFPANILVTSATVDMDTTRISFEVEGGSSFWQPTITAHVVDGSGVVVQDSVAATIDSYIGGGVTGVSARVFAGHVDVNSQGTRTVTLTASTGATTTITLTRAGAGPSVVSVTPSYPGTQTALKQNDVFQVVVVTDPNATYVELVASGAVKTLISSTSYTTLGNNNRQFTINATASALSGAQLVTARAKNSLGTFGANVTASVTMDQVYPTVSLISTSYPNGQSAVKVSESATLTFNLTGYTSSSFTTSADFTISGTSTTFENTNQKTLTVKPTSTSNVDTGTNWNVTVTRASNGATATTSGLVTVYTSAPRVAITGASSRLVSSPTGAVYPITFTFDQALSSAPTISIPVGAGSLGAVTGSGKVYTASLTVADASTRGTFQFSVDSAHNTAGTASATGSANPPITAGANYTIGGFTQRVFYIGPFEQAADIGVLVSDPSKVTVSYTGSTVLTFKGSDLTQAAGGWSLLDDASLVYTAHDEPFTNYSNYVYAGAGVPSKWFYITDKNFADTNTGANGTGLSITIQEVA